jgi:hypothetical protein
VTNLEEVKKRIAGMTADELVEFCGGDSCENILCGLVGDDGFCCHGNHVAYDCAKCVKNFLLSQVQDGR